MNLPDRAEYMALLKEEWEQKANLIFIIGIFFGFSIGFGFHAILSHLGWI